MADYEENFPVSISAHGIQRVIATRFTLKDRQMYLETAFQINQNLLTERGLEQFTQTLACFTLLLLLQGELAARGNHGIAAGWGCCCMAALSCCSRWRRNRFTVACGRSISSGTPSSLAERRNVLSKST